MPSNDKCWIAVEVLWLHVSKLLLEDEDARARVNAAFCRATVTAC